MKSKSLKFAIIIPTLAVLLVGIAIMIVIVGSLSSSATNDLSERLLDTSVSEYTNEFRVFTETAYGILSAITPMVEHHRMRAMTGEEQGVRTEIVELLTDVLLANEIIVGTWTVWEPNAFDGSDQYFANTAFHDATGRFIPYIFREGTGITVEALVGYDDPVDGDFYLGVVRTGRSYVTDPYSYDVGGKQLQIFSVAMPVKENGAVIGAVGIDIDLSSITTIMNAATILDDGYFFLLSPGGLITTHPNLSLQMTHYQDTWLSDYSREINEVLSGGGSFTLISSSDAAGGEFEFLGRGITIGNTGIYWLIGGIVPITTVNAASQSLLWTIIIVGLLVIVVVGVTIFFIISRSLKNLPILMTAANDIAIGGVEAHGLDYGTDKTKNEITLLERAFANMIGGIRTQSEVMSKIADGDYSVTLDVRSNHDVMNQSINRMLESTNYTLNQINAAAGQVTTGSRQVAEGAQSLAHGSTEQATAIEGLSKAITKIAQMTKDNAATAERTSKLSEDIKESAEKGSHHMNEMMVAVNDINEASKNIENIIKTIDDIAFQTNILALNAAVEAARAGQHGKGFAVVAEEVRNLASKSAEAAKDTGDMIAHSIQKAELGSKIAGETAASLHEIVQGIQESTKFIAEIAKASGEQAEGISLVNGEIDQVGRVVSQNTATAEESAASSEEISGQADVLQQLIAHFKLSESGNSSMRYLG